MNLHLKEALKIYLDTTLQDSVFDMEISTDYMTRDIMASESAVHDFIDESLEASFTDVLLKHIDQQNLNEVDIYKKAGIDRRLFSKIRSNQNYSPSKSTALSLGIALKLNETLLEGLLASAGYALSRSNKSDLIIRFLINRDIYDLNVINEHLEDHNQKLLGSVIL